MKSKNALAVFVLMALAVAALALSNPPDPKSPPAPGWRSYVLDPSGRLGAQQAAECASSPGCRP